MFKPTTSNVVAPVTTPVFGNPADGEDAAAYVSVYKATDPNTIATVGSIIYYMASIAVTNEDDELSKNVRNTFRKGAPQKIMDILGPPTAGGAGGAEAGAAQGVEEVTEDEENRDAIAANQASVPNWLANLINAAHKKPLDEKNVEGFFAMLGHSGTKNSAVARLINQLAPFFPDSISDVGFRNLLKPGIWTTYRNTRVATGGILLKLLDDFRALGITEKDDEVEKAIEKCSENHWDTEMSMLIPDKYKAYGCIFLEAAGTPIDKWYQGNKARDELPAARVRGAKEIFRTYLDIKNDVAKLKDIKTVPDLKSGVAKGFF
jgi:hypothetical protein